MLNNKKGAELTITTIILIILGVVVLTVLILGFTQGWSNVRVWFTSSGSDFNRAKTQCSVACATEDKINWCNDIHFIKNAEATSCNTLANNSEITKCPAINC